jgi:hypothetical protein
MSETITQLKVQFQGIVEELGKGDKDISPVVTMLGLIATLLFVLIEVIEEKK